MPWKETNEVDQREEFVLEALAKKVPFCELCSKYGISTKTGYKWLKRFRKEGGFPALQNRSRRPKTSPGGLPEDVVCRIVRLKQAHPSWGPRKIRALYERKFAGLQSPSDSSFKRVLEKAGMVEKRPSRRAAAQTGRLQERRQAMAPNEVWTVDFKGWWLAGDGMRCEPLTIRDAYSRYILCADPVEYAGTEAVRSRFEQVFKTYGLPRMIRSDNGVPFASSRALLGLSTLSVWWLVLGISLDRIDPGRPDQNGSHERMHRDISLEVEGTARGSLEDQRAALAVWRETYNSERPHQALQYRTPAQLYKLSDLRYDGTPDRIQYSSGYAERMVKRNGEIRIRKTNIFLSTTLRGWNVGLREERSGERIGVWLGKLRLGEIDPQTESFIAADRAVEMPP